MLGSHEVKKTGLVSSNGLFKTMNDPETKSAFTLHLPPPRIEPKILHANGKVLSNYQIKHLYQRLSTKPNGYYSPYEVALPYPILKADGQHFAVTPAFVAGGMGEVHDIEEVETGKWYVAKTLFHPQINDKKLTAISRHEHQALVAAQRSKSSWLIPHKEKNKKVILMQAEQGATFSSFFPSEKKGAEHKSPLKNQLSLLEKVYFAMLLFKVIDEDFHSKNLIHGDIKLENILATWLAVTLIDYTSVSKETEKSNKHLPCTLNYLAPELTCSNSTQKRTKASDVYAAGLVFHELLLGQRSGMIRGKLIKGELDKNIPDSLKMLVNNMMNSSPGKRPTINEAFQVLHNFFNKEEFAAERKKIEAKQKNYIKQEKRRLDKLAKEVERKREVINGRLDLKSIKEALREYRDAKGSFRWIFFTSDETRDIIKKILKNGDELQEAKELIPLEQQKRFSQIRKYVMENKDKKLAKIFYKRFFKNDLEVNQVYDVQTKARPCWRFC